MFVLAARFTLAATATMAAACAEGRAVDMPPSGAPPVSLTIAPRDTVVEAGTTLRYATQLRDANGRDVSATSLRWISRDPAVMNVNASGAAVALVPGSARVVATSGTLSDSSTVTVVAPAPAANVTIAVNTAQRTPISRLIYGMNLTGDIEAPYTAGFPWYGARPPAGVTLDRFGGNRFSAYNWENNFSNAGSDYQYQSDDFLSASRTPAAAVTARVAASRRRGAATLVTVPMIGYVAADGNGPMEITDATRATRLASRFRVSLPNKPSALSVTPNANDGTVYQDEFVFAMTRAFPGATGEALAPMMFSLDNEPDSWHATHKEILSDSGGDASRPRLQTYDGFLATTVAHAAAIKRVAPDAMVFGPAFATYTGVLTLGRYPHPDPQHGTRSFVEFYVEKIAQAERSAGHRLVDVLDLHWYPATGTNNGEVTNDYAPQDAAMIEKRVQAPRSLWDPTFDEQSWVSGVTNGPIALVPRLRTIIERYNPGMKIAFTEYFFGRAGDISGGLAQADLLGIFGREGVYAACFWPQASVFAPPYLGSGERAYAYAFGAFRSFVDYDGRGARFGDIGVATTVSDRVSTSAYGSVDAQGRIVLVLINKLGEPSRAAIALDHPTPQASAQAYVMRDGVASPQVEKRYTVTGNRAVIDLPPRSVTTLQFTP